MMVSGKQRVPASLMPDQFGGPDMSGPDLASYVAVLYRRKLWVLAGVFGLLGLVIVYNRTATPIFGARAEILLADQGRPVVASPDPSALAASPYRGMFGSPIETQSAILRSKTLIASATSFMRREPQFIRAMTDGQKSQLTVNDIRQLLRKHSAPEAAPPRPDPELKGIIASLTVSPLEKADVVQIKASSPNSRRAHDFVNALSAVYLIGMLERSQRVATASLDYVNEQVQTAAGRLQTAEAQLTEFSQRSGVVEPEAQAKNEVERVAALQAEVLAARSGSAAKQAQVATMSRQLSGVAAEVESARTVVSNPVVSGLQSRLVELNVERSNLLGKYTPTSSKVKDIDLQIETVKNALKKETAQVVGSRTNSANPVHNELFGKLALARAEARAQAASVAPLQHALDDARREMAGLPQNQVQMARLRREQQLAEKQYVMLRQKQEEFRLAQEAQISGSELLEPARLADSIRVSPRKTVNMILGMMAGLLFGLLLAFVTERVDDKFLDPASAEVETGLPVLGQLPNLRGSAMRGLPGAPSGDPAFRECILSLHSNIGFVSPGGLPGSIMISSGQPLEGKTTLAANLALAAAEGKRRVLLVDGDLRHPRVHELLGIERSPGLAELLAGTASDAECVRSVTPEGGPELWVLPAGASTPTPQALLGGRGLDELFKRLRGQMDFVVVDGPPLGEVSDAQILGNKVEAVVLVFTLQRARRGALLVARSLLARANANVLGLVLNRTAASRRYY